MRLICSFVIFALSSLSAWASGPVSQDEMLQRFTNVVERIHSVAVRECRRQTTGMSCDFRFVLDKRSSAGANAHQTLDAAGNPVIRVTKRLLAKLTSDDEIAFILAHEAGHHIGGHLARFRNTTGLRHISFASLGMEDEVAGSRAQRRAFELEADGLGAIITRRAGYDAIKGAACLDRMHAPGQRHRATHPPFEQRMSMVRRVLHR